MDNDTLKQLRLIVNDRQADRERYNRKKRIDNILTCGGILILIEIVCISLFGGAI
jgi:hypothetical protein